MYCREIPILMSGPLVRATLEGAKPEYARHRSGYTFGPLQPPARGSSCSVSRTDTRPAWRAITRLIVAGNTQCMSSVASLR